MSATETTTVEEKTTIELGLEPSIEAGQANVRLSGVGMVRADRVDLTNSAAGLVIAGGQVKIERGGARTVIATGPIDITQGGGGAIMTLGDMHISQGGGGILLARNATVREGGFVALAVSPRLTIEQGGRVLAGPREMALLGIAAAAGAALAVLVASLLGMRRRADVI